MHIPTNLPRGMSAVIINGTIRYRVRISRNGQRFNLGTFMTAYDAAVAMEKFRCGLHVDLLNAKTEVREEALTQEEISYKALLDSAPMHQITRDEDAHLYDENLDAIVTVPSYIVNLWLNEYNEKLKADTFDSLFGGKDNELKSEE